MLRDLHHLGQLQDQTELKILGTMSGTSGDGLDWCRVVFTGLGRYPRFHVEDSGTVPYPADFQDLVARPLELSANEINAFHFELGRWMAQVLPEFTENCDAIAIHGQTLLHQPPTHTLQVGHGEAIRAATGLPVIGDFRSADILAGGEGAPLIPVVDEFLFHDRNHWVLTINIGGIANLTALPPRGSGMRTLAWDSGPGNTLMDQAMHRFTSGEQTFDSQGQRAAAGEPWPELANRLNQHPYLQRQSPKSAGQEQFGAHYLSELLAEFSPKSEAEQNSLLHELARFTCTCIHHDWQRTFNEFPPDEIWVAGGGCHNNTLLAMLRQRFHPARVEVFKQGKLTADNKEAFGFAFLAYLNLRRFPGNIPSVTGAAEPRILGTITW